MTAELNSENLAKQIHDFERPRMRSYYHKRNVNKWLRRYQMKVKPDYMYKPREKVKCQELKQ